MSGWMDTHCHLCLLKSEQGLITDVVERAKDAGVKHILDVSTGPDNWACVMQNAQAFEQVYAAVGVHPTSAAETIDWSLFERLAFDQKVIAIGECGLDFYHEPEDLCRHQYPRFERQIEVAKQAKKPLIIHTRNSSPQTLSMLKQHAYGHVVGIMHCFVEDKTIAQQALDLGFYLSFSGIATFKSASQIQEVIQWAPLDRILVETDAPYLAPVPHRGKLNEPAYTVKVGEKVAELKGLALDELQHQLALNAERLFGIQVLP